MCFLVFYIFDFLFWVFVILLFCFVIFYRQSNLTDKQENNRRQKAQRQRKGNNRFNSTSDRARREPPPPTFSEMKIDSELINTRPQSRKRGSKQSKNKTNRNNRNYSNNAHNRIHNNNHHRHNTIVTRSMSRSMSSNANNNNNNNNNNNSNGMNSVNSLDTSSVLMIGNSMGSGKTCLPNFIVSNGNAAAPPLSSLDGIPANFSDDHNSVIDGIPDSTGNGECGNCKYPQKCYTGCRYGIKKSTQKKKCKWCRHGKCHPFNILSSDTDSTYTSTSVSDSYCECNRSDAASTVPALENAETAKCDHFNVDSNDYCQDCQEYTNNTKSNNTNKSNNTKSSNTNNTETMDLIEIDCDNGNNNNNNNNNNCNVTESDSKDSIIEVSDHESECDPPIEFMICHIDGKKVCKYGCAFTSNGFRCVGCQHKKICVCNHHKLSINF